MFNDRLRRFMRRKATDDEKREYLTELLQKGQQAESLNEFLDEFIAQKQQEILQRLNSNEYPEAIQLEYKIVMEFQQYIKGIATIALQKRNALQKGE